MSEIDSSYVENILKERREQFDSRSGDFESTRRRARAVVTMISMYSELGHFLDDADTRLSVTVEENRHPLEHQIVANYKQMKLIEERLEVELPQVDAVFFRDNVERSNDVLSVIPLHLRLLIPNYGDTFDSGFEGTLEQEMGSSQPYQMPLDAALNERSGADPVPLTGIPVEEPNDLSEAEIDKILSSRK